MRSSLAAKSLSTVLICKQVIIAGSRQESVDKAVQKLETEADGRGRVTGHVLDLNAGSLQDMDKAIEAFLTKVGKIDHCE